jgi:hypothetical protein
METARRNANGINDARAAAATTKTVTGETRERGPRLNRRFGDPTATLVVMLPGLLVD